MPNITGASFEAVKGVFLIGNPERKANLACNVDNFGGKTTANVTGLESYLPGIPEKWVSKTLDVCIFVSLSRVTQDPGGGSHADLVVQGDGVCDTTHGKGINAEHLQYIVSDFLFNSIK